MAGVAGAVLDIRDRSHAARRRDLPARAGSSRILKDLENRGLIVKRISDEDQRFGRFRLTSEGRSFIEAVGASSERIYQELSGRLGEERLAELMLLLRETERLLGEGDLIQFEPGDGKPRRR